MSPTMSSPKAPTWNAIWPPIVSSAWSGPLKARATGLSCAVDGDRVEVRLGGVDALGAGRRGDDEEDETGDPGQQAHPVANDDQAHEGPGAEQVGHGASGSSSLRRSSASSSP